MTTVNLQVGADTDDAHHRVQDATTHVFTVVNPSSIINGRLQNAGNDFIYDIVLFFTSAAIGQGDTIDAADITLQAANSKSGTVVRTNIFAEDIDSADSIDDDTEFHAVARTTASVAWDSIPATTAGSDYTSPDFKAVIQEVVDRGSWASGNNIGIIWEDDGSDTTPDDVRRTWDSYAGDAANAAKLDIDFTTSAQTLSPSGIVSAEAFGSAQLNLAFTASGIASAEAYGAAQLNLSFTATGIVSLEAFGSAQLNLSFTASGIASAEAFGAAQLNLAFTATGIPSAEAFGAASVGAVITGAGIASAEAFGAAQLNLAFTASGIASLEAFGAATVTTTADTAIAIALSAEFAPLVSLSAENAPIVVMDASYIPVVELEAEYA